MLEGGNRGDIRFVPNDSAPEFFITGLHDIHVMPDGWIRFIPFVDRPDGKGVLYREPPYTCITPRAALGPMISLVLQTVPDLIIPKLVAPVRRILMQ